MDKSNEKLLNAEVAFNNNQYEQALYWYKETLKDDPKSIYAISRSGALCVSLGRYDEALDYFTHARELDPENGDNDFNYGNACFFKNDYVGAFEAYVTAEKKKVSDDVISRLYYQLGLICSIRQDYENALFYLNKCAAVDKEGRIALSTDFISEKMKISMLQEDYEQAEKCAAELVAIEPTQLKNYLVYYTILSSHKKYAEAEKVLSDADQYCKLSDAERRVLVTQFGSLYAARAQEDSSYYHKAVDTLEDAIRNTDSWDASVAELYITLADTYLKGEDFDQAIRVSLALLKQEKDEKTEEQADLEDETPEIDEMLERDMQDMQEKIYSGEIPEDMVEADVYYDDEGHEVRTYDFDTAEEVQAEEKKAEDEQMEEPDINLQHKERTYFILLSAYMAKDDYLSAKPYANLLKRSDNAYYHDYGVYASCNISRKQYGMSESTKKQYDSAIAYFRNKSFKDTSEMLPVILRARLYIEEGKKEKAREIADLLDAKNRDAILNYIDTCE